MNIICAPMDILLNLATLLLNVLQRPDGTIDEEADFILSELASWFAINSEAVYGTRPFRVSGEGHSSVVIDGFREDQVNWDEDDFRFVVKDNYLYAYVMKPDHKKTAVITSLKPEETVKSVEFLGSGPAQFTQSSGILIVDLPDRRDTHLPGVLKIQL